MTELMCIAHGSRLKRRGSLKRGTPVWRICAGGFGTWLARRNRFFLRLLVGFVNWFLGLIYWVSVWVTANSLYCSRYMLTKNQRIFFLLQTSQVHSHKTLPVRYFIAY